MEALAYIHMTYVTDRSTNEHNCISKHSRLKDSSPNPIKLDFLFPVVLKYFI